jgi:hypothetical protein
MDMTFSDRMKFDLSGPHRLVRTSDGLYVVGGDALAQSAA